MSLNLNDIVTDGSAKFQVVKNATTNDIANAVNNFENKLGYRQKNKTYATGDIAYHSDLPVGWYLECTTTGTTSSNELTINSPTIGGTVSDGVVTWTIHVIFGAKYYDVPSDINDILSSRVSLVTPTTNNIPTNDEYYVVTTLGNDERTFGSVHQIAVGTNTGKVYSRFKAGTNAWYVWQQQEAIVAKSLNTNGYIRYASGLILQWGTRGTYNTNGIDIYYPISFTKVANIFITIKDTSDIDAKIVAFSDLSDCEKFKPFSNQNSEAYNMSWFAIGY